MQRSALRRTGGSAGQALILVIQTVDYASESIDRRLSVSCTH
ncbi:hypothetical protein E5Q_04500 [Mixia osmundae IAM 14324]|uniref:Uncharacterized protein n=1 Tax=Mixia osmundae (strain CBS 9802 / IAM 14324 / JCM 22182 / KY 12970) TaxID=764103 RepID=G7E4R1_MIXOS|nr:hypothetical protein E5Q_04500 [Mixia osmundae IAM 14324]